MKKKKVLFNQVAIIGVGLIGGSMAMAIKNRKLAKKVVGFSRRKSTINRALKLKAIDEGTLDLKRALKNSDLIILATPAKTIVKFAGPIVKMAEKNAVITDVGSCKQEIVSTIEKISPRSIKFVGAHPLAGSEKKGVGFAYPEMFDNSLCIITPTAKTDSKSYRRVKELWLRLGANVKTLSPSEHDKILAFISHLPHVLAFSLIHSIPDELLKYAPQGLRDMTRIASSDPVIWRDIFTANKKQLIGSIDKFVISLKKFRKLVGSSDGLGLSRTLSSIKNKRDSLK